MNSREIDGHEVAWDGHTVWVNSGEDGTSLARFSRAGIDVHKVFSEQLRTGNPCIACTHRDGEAMTHADWSRFQSLMLEHHGIAVPDDVRPDYLEKDRRVVITKEHLDLLAAMAHQLEVEENFGYVPQFNSKRPLGSSMRPSVARDIWIVLGRDDDEFDWDDEELHRELVGKMRECTSVLRAVLQSSDMLDFVGMEIPHDPGKVLERNDDG